MFENVKKYIELNRKDNEELTKLLLNNEYAGIIIKILTKRQVKNNGDVIKYLRFSDEKFIDILSSNDISDNVKLFLVKNFRFITTSVFEKLVNLDNLSSEIKLELVYKTTVSNYGLINLFPKDLLEDFTKKYIRLDTVKYYFDSIYKNKINKEYSKYIKNNYTDLYIKAIKYYGKSTFFDAWLVNTSYELYLDHLKYLNIKEKDISKYLTKKNIIDYLKNYESIDLFIKNDLNRYALDFIKEVVKELDEKDINYVLHQSNDDYIFNLIRNNNYETLLNSIKDLSPDDIDSIFKYSYYTHEYREIVLKVREKDIINIYKNTSLIDFLTNYYYYKKEPEFVKLIIRNKLQDEKTINFINAHDDKSYIDLIFEVKENYLKSIIENLNLNEYNPNLNIPFNKLSKKNAKRLIDLNKDIFDKKIKNLDKESLLDVIEKVKVNKRTSFMVKYVVDLLYVEEVDEEIVYNLILNNDTNLVINNYEKFKIYLNDIIDINLIYQYALGSEKETKWFSKLISIINYDKDTFIKTYNFIKTNFYSEYNDANKVRIFIESIDHYIKYKNLFKEIDNFTEEDIFSINLLINNKLRYFGDVTSLETLRKVKRCAFEYYRDRLDKSNNISELTFVLKELIVDNDNFIEVLKTVGNIEELKLLEVKNSNNKVLVDLIEEVISLLTIRINFSSDEDVLKYVLTELLSEEDNIIKETFNNSNSIHEKIRRIYELDSQNNLTKISDGKSLINKELTDKYGVTTYDFSKSNYCLYAHVLSHRETLEEVIYGSSSGSKNYISMSPVSYMGQKYYYSHNNNIFAYDTILDGSFVCSSLQNMGTNGYLNKNSYMNNNIMHRNQKGILDTSAVKDNNAEALFYREGLIPKALILVSGKEPTEEELDIARKYNLSFVITQEASKCIEKPEMVFKRETIESTAIKANELRELRQKLSVMINKKDKDLTGRRIGILTDPHGLLEPTLASLVDMKLNGINEIYSLGDNITVGPSSKEVLELLHEYNVKSISGNSEYYYTLGYEPFVYLDKSRIENLDWTYEQIKDYVSYLKELKSSLELNVGNKKISLVHFLNDIRWDYRVHSTWTYQEQSEEERYKQFLYTNSPKYNEDLYKFLNKYGLDNPKSKGFVSSKIDPLLSGKLITDYDYIFEGHTHFETIDKVDKTHIYTVPSVSMSKNAVYYIIEELTNGEINIKKREVPFSHKSMMSSIYASNMPSNEKVLSFVNK